MNEYNIPLLNERLKQARDAYDMNYKAVRALRIVAHQIPSKVQPLVGGAEDGDAFLHFENERGNAYLTADAHALHLLHLPANGPNIYIDDEPFVGKRLPTNIRNILTSVLA